MPINIVSTSVFATGMDLDERIYHRINPFFVFIIHFVDKPFKKHNIKYITLVFYAKKSYY